MKSKYTKIFMIFAVVFAMFAALFVSPNFAYAEGEEEQVNYTVLTEADLESDSLDAKIKHDLKAIIASTPDTAYISFPLTYKSAYKNEIKWDVQEGAVAIKYDSIGNWMIVNRSAETSYTETIYVIINNTYQYNFEISIPKGITHAPSYNINYFDSETELTLEKDKYTLGEETFALAEYEKEGYEFAGWYTNPEFTGDKVEQVVVGSMTELNLYAKYEAKEFTLTFMNGEEVVSTSKVKYGAELTYPTLEGITGYTQTWDKNITTMPAEDTVINAVWTAKEYKLTFVYDETTEELNVPFGSKVTYPTLESKNGYNLEWDKEITTMPAEDTTITASWEAISYSITYYINGALVENLTPSTFTIEDEVILPVPTQTGYNFNGWYLDSEYTTSYNSFSGRYENLVVYGKFELKTGFELSFDVLGGSAVSPIPGAFGEEITLGSSEKTGYEFKGWEGEDGTIYQLGDTYVFGEQGETLTAQWEAIEYTVTYNGVEASEHSNPGTYSIESEKIVLADPTEREHYTFLGWFDAEGKEVTEIATGSYGNVELIAKWEANPYTITYNGVEASEHSNPGTYTIESEKIVLTDPTEREHYTFLGWFDAEGKEVTEIATGSYGNVELTAKWEAIEYTVTYNGVEASEHSNPGTYTIESEKIVLADPTEREHYTFLGWFDAEGKEVTEIATGSYGNVELTAKWEANPYTITYNGVEASEHSNPGTYTIESKKIVLTDPTEREHYTFLGWFDAEGKEVTEIAKGSHGAITLTAQWEVKEYTVIFNDANGTKISEVTANYGSEIAKPEDPSMNGYEFVAWTINGNEVTFPLTVSASDMVLTAKYEAVEYAITYVLNNGTNNASNPASYTIETATITLANPTKHGYEFKGWFDENSNEVTEIALGSTGDITLTAQWEILPLQQYVEEDAAAILADYPLLTGSFFKSPYSALATTGDNGSTILWSTSSAAFYVQNDGTVVVANVLGEESEVVLTATVQYVDSETGTAYVKNVEYKFVVEGIYEIVDEDTNVKVSNIPGQHTLTVTEVTESTGGFTLNDGETLLVAYDIKFDGGNTSELDQKVTVLLPLPENFTTEEEVILYHFKGEQQETVEYEVVTIDNAQYIQFTADSFSPYVLAKVATAAEEQKSYILVEDASKITNGTVIIITNKDSSKVLGAQNGKYRTAVNASADDLSLATIITVEKSEGGLKLKTGEGTYLYYSGSDNSVHEGAVEDGSDVWTIVINENSEFIITNVKYNTRVLQYNSGSPRFACYTGSQQNLTVYADPDTLGESGSTIIESEIEYVLDGGVLPEGAKSTYVEGEGLSTLPVPTKEGYKFLGWYQGENKVEAISSDATGKVTLTAKWEDENASDSDDPGTELEQKTYSYTFVSKQYSANGTKDLNGVNWTLAGDGGYWGNDSTKGQQFGSGKLPYKTLTLTSDSFNKVSKIVINTSGASDINGSFTVTVGGTQVGSSTKLTATATGYTFEIDDPLSGPIVFSYTQSSSKAIYIKSIEVTYAE